MNVKKPELVSPAGDWCSLHSAVQAGADAVYFGIKNMNMREMACNFDILEIEKIMKFLHGKGKKGYLTLNVFVLNNEISKIKEIARKAKDAHVDAVILWDMAVLSIVRGMGLDVHLSTQAGVSNFLAVKSYALMGVKRIVLARECTLVDIADIISRIHEEEIDCSIETFIHGAMCVSISGRCFLSHETFSKSANKGECLQPCRRKYRITDVDEECEYILGEDYVLSAKDLCSILFIDTLISSGIDAFKIEGRMRAPEYVSIVTASYRQAIDAFGKNKLSKKLKNELLSNLEKVYNRGFDDGFYSGSLCMQGGVPKAVRDKAYIGDVIKYFKKIGVAEILIRTKSLKAGDNILLTGKRIPASFHIITEMEINHNSVDKAVKGDRVGVKLPFRVHPRDKVFLFQRRLDTS